MTINEAENKIAEQKNVLNKLIGKENLYLFALILIWVVSWCSIMSIIYPIIIKESFLDMMTTDTRACLMISIVFLPPFLFIPYLILENEVCILSTLMHS